MLHHAGAETEMMKCDKELYKEKSAWTSRIHDERTVCREVKEKKKKCCWNSYIQNHVSETSVDRKMEIKDPRN